VRLTFYLDAVTRKKISSLLLTGFEPQPAVRATDYID